MVVEFRLGGARTTKDIHLRLSGSPDAVLSKLQQAGELALNGFLRRRRDHGELLPVFFRPTTEHVSRVSDRDSHHSEASCLNSSPETRKLAHQRPAGHRAACIRENHSQNG